MDLSKEEKAKLGELLVKMRDSRQSEAEAIDQFLHTLAQNEIQETNVSQIEWQQKEGSKGSYEMATRELRYAHDYDLLVRELEEHNSRMTKGAFFYWLFEQQNAIGRKPSRR